MKAILFDWSETLVSESSKNNLKPFCDSFIRSCKIKPLSSDVEKVLNRVFLKITENLKNKKLTVPFRLIYKIIADILGTESAYSIEEAEYDCYTSTYNITAKNNSYAVLSALQNKNLDIGIITNNRFSSKTISTAFSSIFPGIKLSACISSADYVIGKPDPIIFEIALKKLNCSREDALFCGDRIKYDINGALNAGMESILLKSERKQSVPKNVKIIKDISEILNLI